MDEDVKTFEVSVVVFPEDSQWTALALEMNIRGYGPTAKAAMEDLTSMIVAQISFAVQMGHPESVWHPAEDQYWRIFNEARRKRFVAAFSGAPADPPFADTVPLPATLPSADEWIAARA